jgi:hypothetical protein
MPKPPKPISDLDQKKVGLQDDHDPRDPAQKQNDKPVQPSDDRDKQFPPGDESKFG